MPERKTPVTAISAPVAVRDEIRLMSLQLSVKVGYHVSVAKMLGALTKIGKGHEQELEEFLKLPTDESESDE